jgi:hypothetical protein
MSPRNVVRRPDVHLEVFQQCHDLFPLEQLQPVHLLGTHDLAVDEAEREHAPGECVSVALLDHDDRPVVAAEAGFFVRRVRAPFGHVEDEHARRRPREERADGLDPGVVEDLSDRGDRFVRRQRIG